MREEGRGKVEDGREEETHTSYELACGRKSPQAQHPVVPISNEWVCVCVACGRRERECVLASVALLYWQQRCKNSSDERVCACGDVVVV